MSRIPTNVAPTRRGFLVVLFSAFLAFAVIHDPGLAAAQPVKQIKLTEKQVEGFIAAYKDMASASEKLPEGNDKPDPKILAELDAAAKKFGFTNYAEYEDVYSNISMIVSGIDPQTKKFTEPPEAIKKEIEELKADKSLTPEQKKQELADLNAALKNAKPIQFRENIALVIKYFDKLLAAMQA